MPFSDQNKINVFDAKILIVDDNLTNIALLEDILDDAGYTHLFSTSDSRTVVDLYIAHEFDLILLDIRMPYMDGHMVMQALSQKLQDDYLPIIVLTAQTDSETRIRALENGAKDFLTKPFDPVEVNLRIRNMLEVRGFYQTKKNMTVLLEQAVNARTKELAEQKTYLQSIMDNAGEAIFTVDATGIIQTVNAFATRLFSKNIDQMIGKNINVYFSQSITALAFGTHELRMTRDDLSEFSLELSINALHDVAEGKVIIARDISERKAAEEKLAYLAHYDQLTALPNRFSTQEKIRALLDTNQKGAITYLSIDQLQYIHDTFGHLTVEKLICAIAERLRFYYQQCDFLGTWESGEFILIFMEKTSLSSQEVIALLDQIILPLTQPYFIEHHEIIINYHVGISFFDPHDEKKLTIEKLIQQVALANFFGKNKNPTERYHFFEESMEHAVAERHLLERELRHAIERTQLELFYQPKINLSTQKIMGAEALIRWRHPEFGLVPPLKFIPLAEETGLIVQIGHWVLEQAIIDSKRWQQQFDLTHFNIAVNVSAHQFDSNLAPYVTNLLDQHQFDPKNLELEITESAIMRDIDTALFILEDFRKLGIGIAIDDFGTGYSSLAYLRRLPITTLKIDASFIRDIVSDVNAQSIASTIIAMSQTLNLNTVAEGIETLDHEAILKNLNCHYGQGYFYAKPVPAHEFEQLIGHFNPHAI